MSRHLRYNPKLKSLARKLRTQGTLSEVLLWRYLQSGQRYGYDFHRQKPIDEYIVDFFSPGLMLAIEIDGVSHKLKGDADETRQSKLEALGIRMLRFEDRQIREQIDGVIRAIDDWIETNVLQSGSSTHPALRAPLSRGDFGQL